MQTRANERREFIRRLRTDPVFLSKHTGALSLALCRKLGNRITLALTDVHRGRKKWPNWLEQRELPQSRPDAGKLAGTLPQYASFVGSLRADRPSMGPIAQAEHQNLEDVEDYFADNRWGFLLQSLLEGAADWNGGIARCLRWVESHTHKTDRAWEAYSSCERIANLLVFLAAMPGPLRRVATDARVDSFLVESLHWVYRHLEYYGPAETNNHLLNNARALVMGGVATRNSAAVAAAVKTLRWCLPEMIGEGGFLRERSSHYQLVVLNWLLDTWQFLSASLGQDSADARFLRGYVERMVTAAAMLCDRDGKLTALIGDISPDVTPAQSSERLGLLYPDFWPIDAVFTQRCLVRDGWFRLSDGKSLVLGNLPSGQYPFNFPTHGHCDATHFVFRHQDQEILVDPGRYRYTRDAVSEFQQSALGHNLPLVNGFAPLCESVISDRKWCPVPYARAQLQVAEYGDDIVLQHDGFARSTPVRFHRRRLSLTETGLIVIDSFEGEASVWLELCWHFAEDFQRVDAHGLRLRGGRREVRMLVDGVPGPASIRPACDVDPGGWVSRAYGQRRPALALCLRWQVVLPTVVTTQFQVTKP